GRTLAVAVSHFGVRLWDVAAAKRLKKFCPPVATLALGDLRVLMAPDGKRVLAWAGQKLWLWDVATGQEIGGAPRHGGSVNHLQFTADGRELMSAERYTWNFPSEVMRWDARTWQRLGRWDRQGLSRSPETLFFSPDFHLEVRCRGSGELYVAPRDAAAEL